MKVGSTVESTSESSQEVEATNNKKQESDGDEKTLGNKEEKQDEAKPEAYDQHGDPEMAPVYLKHLLPIFTRIHQTTILPSVKYTVACRRAMMCF